MTQGFDTRKKLQEQANNILKEAELKTGIPLNKELEDFLNGLIVLSLKQGYIWGVTTIKQVSDKLLEDVKGTS